MKRNKRKRTAREVLGFNDFWAMLIGIPLISFLVPIAFFNASLAEGIMPYLPRWGVSFLYTLSYWIVCRWVFITVRKRFPRHDQTRKRWIFTFLEVVVSFFIINALLEAFHMAIGVHNHPPGASIFDLYISSFMIVALVSTLYESVFLYHRWKETIVEAEKLKRENVESQLEGLKSQVNPHFLFNSLNTLAYIIPEDPNKAVKFVQKLSKAYRYILEIQDVQLIALEEELHFLKAYNFLLKERFGDNLSIVVNAPQNTHRLHILPLSLQILFENAIKHNIISKEHPLHIELWVDDKSLCVRNNLQRKPQVIRSTKIGLQNIKNRYAYFTKEQVSIQETDEYFMVCLPLIKLPVVEMALT
jgi:two-component system LytT family sensor kinase